MKKSLLALCIFLPLLLLLPSAAAQKAFRTGKRSRTAAPPSAPAAPRPARARQSAPGQGAEAETAAPGATLDPARLPKETRPTALLTETEIEEEMLTSDLDPATLKRLKLQPYAAAAAPPSHTTQEDSAARPSNEETPRSLAPTQLRSFTGPDSDDQLDGSLHRPPDTDMAAGPNHVVTVVNSMIVAYSKTGTPLQSNSLASRFSNVCAGCSPFDPRVTYDTTANRWLVLALEQDNATVTSRILLSVSQTSDPTGAWWNYSLNGVLNFNSESTWADYPDLSFDGIPAASGGAVYVSTNQFTFGSNSFRTSMILILPKSSLYSGGSLSFWRAFDRRNADGSQAFTMRAAKTYGNPGFEYLINTRNAGSYVSVWRIAPTYPPADVNMTLQTTINIGAYAVPPNARQPGCTATLDTGDNRMYNAVWRNNRLYAAFTEAHDWGGGGGTVAAVRFLKINTSSNTAELNQTYGADGLNYSFPAIATDNADNIVLAFACTGTGEYASIRYTGRLATDTTTQGSAELKAGVQCLNGDRFGDYQGASIDPADGSKVWVYGEWAANTPGADSIWDWGTWVGQVQFGGVACNYSISPASNSVGAAAASGSVSVTTGAGCAWSASSNVPWLSVTSGATGTGSGTVGYTVAANTVNLSRTGTLTVADQTFTVTQAAGVCASSSPISFGQTANGTLSTTDCRAVNQSGSYADRYTFGGTAGQQIVISLSSAAYDTYLYLYAPNGTLAASDDDGGGNTNSRIPAVSGAFTLPATGTYTIEATSFTSGVTGPYALTLQSVCTYSISPTSQSFASGGGTGSVAVTAPAGCAWTATSGSSFMTVNSGASGSGNGTVGYTVAANASTSTRSGTLTVAGLTFTANQAASTASSVQLSAATVGVNESARKVLVNVTRTGNTAAAASVNYATSDGTASRLRDYTQTLGTLDFAPGETTKTVTVFVTNDVFAESAETFSFTLSNAAGATLGSPSSATVTITSDDATNGVNPVGDAAFNADFFVRQHYVDFLNREADDSGLAFWTGEITQCGADVACRDVKRINVSAAFFLSIEFQNTGYLVYRFYKAAYGDATSPGVAGTVPVIRLDEFLPDTQRIGRGVIVNQGNWQAQLEANKQAYALEFAQRARFLAAFPASLTPAQFVDKLRTNTGAALTQAERDQLVAELSANNTTAGRASVLRKVAENASLQTAESNRAFVLMQYYGYLRRNP
ncbi:MAG: Calx-beta domain-containing protein, partial [Pyrinomonadaceae bacterium]